MEHSSGLFAVLGGDRRLYWTARGLRDQGHGVRVWGLEDPKGEFPIQSLAETLSGAEYVILPGPAFTPEGQLNGSGPALGLEDLLDRLEPAALVFGGKLGAWEAAFRRAGIRTVDYLGFPALAVANAVPAAAAI